MGSHVKVFAVFAVGLLLSHCAIISVEGQCTVEGCENEDPSIGFEAAMEKLRVELFSHVNKQVQNIRHLLISSFQQLKCFHESDKIESRNGKVKYIVRNGKHPCNSCTVIKLLCSRFISMYLYWSNYAH